MIESLTSSFGASLIVSPKSQGLLRLLFQSTFPTTSPNATKKKCARMHLTKFNFYINIIRNESVMILLFMDIKLDFALLVVERVWIPREAKEK
jgi:hypothetical protein